MQCRPKAKPNVEGCIERGQPVQHQPLFDIRKGIRAVPLRGIDYNGAPDHVREVVYTAQERLWCPTRAKEKALERSVGVVQGTSPFVSDTGMVQGRVTGCATAVSAVRDRTPCGDQGYAHTADTAVAPPCYPRPSRFEPCPDTQRCERPLMVAINHQHPLPLISQGRRKVERDRGLADAALEGQDGDHRTATVLAQGDEAGGVVRKGTFPNPSPLRRHTLKVSFQLVDLLALAAVEAPELTDIDLAFSEFLLDVCAGFPAFSSRCSSSARLTHELLRASSSSVVFRRKAVTASLSSIARACNWRSSALAADSCCSSSAFRYAWFPVPAES